MKKIILSLVMAFLSLTILPVQSSGANPDKPDITAPAPKPADEAAAKVLISRLNEINAMDKTKLNSSEKKDLRKEVKSIKKELKAISGGIYLSAMAIIIILLVLLLVT